MHSVNETPEWYIKWLGSIKPGDMVYVGARDRRTVYYWLVSDVEDGYIYANEFEFETDNGYGPPGKLLFPSDRVVARFGNQGLADKIESMCDRGDLTHLSRDALLEIHDKLMDEYENAGHWPNGLRERESRYSGKSRKRSGSPDSKDLS